MELLRKRKLHLPSATSSFHYPTFPVNLHLNKENFFTRDMTWIPLFTTPGKTFKLSPAETECFLNVPQKLSRERESQQIVKSDFIYFPSPMSISNVPFLSVFSFEALYKIFSNKTNKQKSTTKHLETENLNCGLFELKP